MNSIAEEYITLGKIGRAKGLKGLFFVQLYHESSDFFSYAEYMLVGENPEHAANYTITSAKFEKDRWLVGIEGVGDRTLAQALVNQNIYYPRKDLPEVSEGEVYVHDLIGMTVLDENQSILGQVSNVVDSKAHEILAIVDVQTKKEWFCPFHEHYVEEVDLDKKELILKNWEELREI